MTTLSSALHRPPPSAADDLSHRLGFWAKYAFVDSALIHTALRLGLFQRLPVEGDTPVDVVELARRLGASVRGTRVACEPLAASGVLVADQRGRLAVPQAVASQLRDPGIAARLGEAAKWWYAARQLAHVIRGGEGSDRNRHRLLERVDELFLKPSHDTPLLDRATRNYWRTATLMAANELGLLDSLSIDWCTNAEFARRLECAPEGVRILLRTLSALNVLETRADGDAFRWSPATWEHVGGRNLAAFQQGLTIAASFWGALGQLAAVVLDDRRVLDLQDPARSAAFYLALARYNTLVFPGYFRLARRVVATIHQLRSLAGAAILDVGSGSGVWGTAFVGSIPTARATFLDRAQVLDQTRRNVARLGLAERARLWPADLLAADFGSAAYDVILLGQICHTQSPEVLPDLLGRLARALRPGGTLVLADCILDARRAAPQEYLYFGVKEFTSTRGDVLSEPEYVRLLQAAGLGSLRLYRPGGVDVILASDARRAWPDRLAQANVLAAEVTA